MKTARVTRKKRDGGENGGEAVNYIGLHRIGLCVVCNGGNSFETHDNNLAHSYRLSLRRIKYFYVGIKIARAPMRIKRISGDVRR